MPATGLAGRCRWRRQRRRYEPTVIVVDASVLSVALGDDAADGATARSRLRDQTVVAPELIDLEVVSVLRRQVAAGLMTPARAELAVADLSELPMRRATHRPLLFRCWELRHTVTPYDAAYIALAELLRIVLVTADGLLSRAPGVRCEIDVIA